MMMPLFSNSPNALNEFCVDLKQRCYYYSPTFATTFTLYLFTFAMSMLAAPDFFFGPSSIVPLFDSALTYQTTFLARCVGLCLLALVVGRKIGIREFVWLWQALAFNVTTLALFLSATLSASAGFTLWVLIAQDVVSSLLLVFNLRSLWLYDPDLDDGDMDRAEATIYSRMVIDETSFV